MASQNAYRSSAELGGRPARPPIQTAARPAGAVVRDTFDTVDGSGGRTASEEGLGVFAGFCQMRAFDPQKVDYIRTMVA